MGRGVGSVLLVVLLLGGCGGGAERTPTAPVVTATLSLPPLGSATTPPTSTVPASAAPQPTRTAAVPVVHADCGWSGAIETWLDGNENGRWDAGESPLPGVLIVASDGRGYSLYSLSRTGADGRVTMTAQPRGCSEPGLMVSTQWPSGYRPTTAAILPPHDYPTPYRFGFVVVMPAGGTPTRTAQP